MDRTAAWGWQSSPVMGRSAGNDNRVTIRRDLATKSLPSTPVAPALLSITIGWPSVSDISCDRTRATASVGPPGGHGTTTRMGRLGYSAAAAGHSPRAESMTSTTSRICDNPRPIRWPLKRALVPSQCTKGVWAHSMPASSWTVHRFVQAACRFLTKCSPQTHLGRPVGENSWAWRSNSQAFRHSGSVADCIGL